jgi:hypothetical protein
LGGQFDCIVGNPPWEGRQRKQVAQKFLEKVPRFLKNGGTGCLLLPTKILQNQTDTFQAEWLQQVTLERVIQLADYRFLLFQNALCPAIIARFTNTPPQPGRHQVEFNAPKFNRNGLRKGVIIVNPSVSSRISLADLLASTKKKTAPVVWKRHLWGTPRDRKLLDLLQSLPSLRDNVDLLSELRRSGLKRTKKWIAGQGLKPWPRKKSLTDSDRAPKGIKWSLGMKFIEASPWDCDLLLIPDDTISFEERLKNKQYRTDVLYSQPPTSLFCNPMVLVSQGFGKVAYCDFDVLFQHSLQSIAGPPEDADFLKFLAAYLRSGLAKYFLFHTAANWGSERDKVHLFELLRVPFPLPGDDFISPDAERIVKKAARKIDNFRKDIQDARNRLKADARSRFLFGQDEEFIKKQWFEERKKRTDALQEALEPLIYGYFGLTDQEIILVQDTIRVFEPSSTPTTWHSGKTVTLNPVENANVEPYTEQGIQAYADTLTKTLNIWARTEGSNNHVRAEAGIDEQTGLAMVTIYLSDFDTAFKAVTLPEDLTNILKDLHTQASRRRGRLVYERDILHFEGDRIHIVRPNILLNWTRTAAFNDAARIYGEIALADKES